MVETPFYKETWRNVDWYCNQLNCFDLTVRSVQTQKGSYYLCYVGGVSGSSVIESIVKSLLIQQQDPVFFPCTVNYAGSLQQGCTMILQGQTLVLSDQLPCPVVIDTRSSVTRGTAEPETEKSIRGARDGFVEHIMSNLGMVRRRLKDPHLVSEAYQKGTRTHTDIFVLYCDDRVDQQLIGKVHSKLQQLENVEGVESERQLCQLMFGQSWNPYPHVRYTERPDITAIHLMQGSVVILVDNCCTAMILPVTFFEQTKQIEEYTQMPVIALVTSLIRLSGVLASIVLLPLWMVFVIEKNPTLLKLPLPQIPGPITFGVQVLIADLLIEWIRLALIHSPSILSSLLGIVAVFVLGDAPIAYGAYTQEILIMAAVVNIGNFVTAGYELSMANKIVRLAMIVVVIFFGYKGFLVSLVCHLILLLKTESGPYSYLYPLIPFDFKEFKRFFSTKIGT